MAERRAARNRRGPSARGGEAGAEPREGPRRGGGVVRVDRLVHGRIRLGILSGLAVNPSLGFTELRDLLGTTDGNLSVHARRLEDAGYVTCTKSFDGRLPRTRYRLSAKGRRALERYLDHMEALIRATRES